LIWIFFIGVLVMAVVPAAGFAQPPDREPPVPIDLENLAPAACDPDGTQQSGAVYRICMPPSALWNGDLVVYAHGYVRPAEPVGIPEDQMVLPGTGISVADVVTSLGYGFATTSYSTNGLAVRQGLADLADLVGIFAAQKGSPGTVYLVGVSEGGLITALAVEASPDLYDGGLALCGPYGDFTVQINYLADMRAVFDYFFPGLIPGSAVEIPQWLVTGWDAYYEATVKPQLVDPANAARVDQLLRVTQAPYDPQTPGSKEAVIYDVLSYNVEGTNDAVQKLGGQPFDNRSRVYSGSNDDVALNRGVVRYDAAAAALDEIEAGYQTSGSLALPLVTLHTTGDHVVTYWQSTRYRGKTISADNIALHEARTADRYGHCQFEAAEVLGAFNRLVSLVENPPPYRPVQRSFLPLTVRRSQ
jgi:pimeloyl-ACP methyl ester carboxylesterase